METKIDGPVLEALRAGLNGAAYTAGEDRYDPHNLFRFNRNIPPSSAAE